MEMLPCRLEDHGEKHLLVVRSTLPAENFVLTTPARLLLYHTSKMAYRGLATWKRMPGPPR
jgi:hypothetical protein